MPLRTMIGTLPAVVALGLIGGLVLPALALFTWSAAAALADGWS